MTKRNLNNVIYPKIFHFIMKFRFCSSVLFLSFVVPSIWRVRSCGRWDTSLKYKYYDCLGFPHRFSAWLCSQHIYAQLSSTSSLSTLTSSMGIQLLYLKHSSFDSIIEVYGVWYGQNGRKFCREFIDLGDNDAVVEYKKLGKTGKDL